jgi:hypothetical protein
MEVQLPPEFKPHPEQAVGLISVDDAIRMIELEMLTYAGAYYLLPQHAWVLLPRPKQVEAEPQRLGWMKRMLGKAKFE